MLECVETHVLHTCSRIFFAQGSEMCNLRFNKLSRVKLPSPGGCQV